MLGLIFIVIFCHHCFSAKSNEIGFDLETMQNDTMKEGYESFTFEVRDVLECAIRCLQDDDCSQLSFLKKNRLCVVHSQTGITPSKWARGWRTWKKQGDKTKTHETTPRLLLTSYGTSRKSPIVQVDLHNHTIKPYPYTATVSYLRYIQSSNTLLIVTKPLNSIHSYHNGKNKSTLLSKSVTVFGVAVDQSKEIVFMSITKPELGVGRMKTDGSEFQIIPQLDPDSKHPKMTGPSSITVDQEYELLYCCSYPRMFSTTYEGKDVKLVYENKLRVSSLDPTHRVLYIGADIQLRMMKLPDHNTTLVKRFYKRIIDVICHDGHIYVTMQCDFSVHVVNAQDKTVRTVNVAPYLSERNFWPVICIIT